MPISTSGGTAPFTLTLVPVFGTPRNISIPDSAYSGGEGSYSTTLPFPASQKFVATMSDATAFGSGGATELLVTGSSLGGSCNTTDPGTRIVVRIILVRNDSEYYYLFKVSRSTTTWTRLCSNAGMVWFLRAM